MEFLYCFINISCHTQCWFISWAYLSKSPCCGCVLYRFTLGCQTLFWLFYEIIGNKFLMVLKTVIYGRYLLVFFRGRLWLLAVVWQRKATILRILCFLSMIEGGQHRYFYDWADLYQLDVGRVRRSRSDISYYTDDCYDVTRCISAA